jgi:hypothetical protein
MKYKTHIITSIFILAIFLPLISFGQGLVQCGNPGQDPCDFTQLVLMINRIIDWFIGISVSIAAIMFSISGARMLMNPENSDERGKAKEMFKKTIMGMLFILLAWLVVRGIVTALVDPSTNALRFLK